MQSSLSGKLALLPLLAFLLLFLGVGFYFQARGVEYAFYQLPAPSALLPAIVLAMFLSKEHLEQSIARFIAGAGHNNIITMCFIYLILPRKPRDQREAMSRG
jgi:Na+/H+ antiporter NhaC